MAFIRVEPVQVHVRTDWFTGRPREITWGAERLEITRLAAVREEAAAFRKGFGSVRVTAEIAGQSWQTSVFPDSRSGSYLLPVKKAVRTAARISAGDEVAVRLEFQHEDEADTGARRGGTG